MKPTVVVPMAGNGQRFVDAGYTTIKPLIPVHGKPMIERVVDSIQFDANWIFIVQKDHREQYQLDMVLQNIRPGCTVIDTGGGVTEGAACSVLLAEPHLNPNAPLIVLNSDNIIKWDDSVMWKVVDGELDGLIPVFYDGTGDPRWSYIQQRNGRVVRVAEKAPISTLATAGMYIWRSSKLFVDAAKRMIAENYRINNEFYIAPVYNFMYMTSMVGYVSVLMHGLGTPEELEYYLSWSTP